MLRLAGSVCSASGVAVTEAETLALVSASGSRWPRKFEYSEPKTEAPNDPPSVRKNVTPEVATPRSW